MKEYRDDEFDPNPLATGSAYLDYCVRQGWLVKKGDGDSATYQMTPEGERKMAKVSFNLDLSRLEKAPKETRRKYKRRK